MATLTAADATVLVAALVGWHERHEPAVSALDALLGRKALIVAAPSLVETYAVLTSLPAHHRLAHADAYHLMRESFGTARIAGAKTRDTWSAMRLWSVAPIGGADAFDALLIDAVRDAGAKTLLTFRRQELERLAGPGLSIEEPV
jgi:predicted nucleic acid-binding protein